MLMSVSSSLNIPLNIFIHYLTIISFVLSGITLAAIYTGYKERAVNVLGLLLLAVLTWSDTSVYKCGLLTSLLIIPSSVYFFKQEKSLILSSIFAVFAGVFITFAHSCKAYTGLPALLVFICVLMGNKSINSKNKAILVSSLLIG